MPNEFKVKNGLIVDQGGISVTGSALITGSLAIVSSGSTIVSISGSQGELFKVIDTPTNLLAEIVSGSYKALEIRNDLLYTSGAFEAGGNITGKNLILTNSSGDEGGEILLAKPATNTTLVGTGISIDSFQDKIRIFEQGGNARGAYLDVSRMSNSVGSEIVTNTYTGSISISSGSIVMPDRPAFRVTGAGGAKAAPTTLSGSYLNVDYQQGSGWNNSTGTFTAPIAGLYQVNVVVRTNSNSLGTISQLIVFKNNTGGTSGTAQVMVEFGANTTMNHAGASTICKLAVGDTLKMVVGAGEISFDINDNFSVAYIG